VKRIFGNARSARLDLAKDEKKRKKEKLVPPVLFRHVKVLLKRFVIMSQIGYGSDQSLFFFSLLNRK